MDKPLVSIIMPAYNAEKYIEDAINSIIIQSYPNWELLIADDASSDSTRSTIESYNDSRIKSYHSKQNIGYLKTCNILFKYCKGEYITFQDADDYSAVDRIALQLSAFMRDKELAICGTQLIRSKNSNHIVDYPIKDVDIKKTLLNKFPFCGATIMITKLMYLKYGGYNEIFDRIGSEDYEWAGRIVKENKGINLSNQSYCYRYNNASITKSINSQEVHISQALAKNIIEFKMNNEEARLLKQKLLEPFINDPSLFFRMNCDYWAYLENNEELKSSAWKAFKSKPFKMINLKYLISSLIRPYL